MSRHWLLWAPFAVFLLGWALLGLRYGYLAASTSESDVIAAYAERYLDARLRVGDEAAKLTDCMATPGQRRGVWVVVTCRGAGAWLEYHVNRVGHIVHQTKGHSGGPQT